MINPKQIIENYFKDSIQQMQAEMYEEEIYNWLINNFKTSDPYMTAYIKFAAIWAKDIPAGRDWQTSSSTQPNLNTSY